MALIDDIVNELEEQTVLMRDAVKERDRLFKQMEEGILAPSYIEKNIKPAYNAAQAKINRIKDGATAAVNSILNGYFEAHAHDDDIKGSEITDDAKLLSAGISLNEQDLENMFERNRGNKTMEQLIERYAKEHSIRIHVHYRPTIGIITEQVDSARSIAKMYVEHWIEKETASDMLRRLFYGDA